MNQKYTTSSSKKGIVMKKPLIIVLCLISVILLATAIVIGILFLKKNNEVKDQKKLVDSQKKQIKSLKDGVMNKDKEINSLKAIIGEKDKTIKSIKKKMTAEKKAKEEAKKVAQIGKYQSDDSTGIVDATEDHPMEGLVRSIDVKQSSRDRITFHLEETHGTKIEGMIDEQVTVSLKNGKGSFMCDFGGGMSGRDDLKFKGTIEILSPTQIKITSLGNDTHWDNGESHKFTKK